MTGTPSDPGPVSIGKMATIDFSWTYPDHSGGTRFSISVAKSRQALVTPPWEWLVIRRVTRFQEMAISG